jgi:hypothetical protein
MSQFAKPIMAVLALAVAASLTLAGPADANRKRTQNTMTGAVIGAGVGLIVGGSKGAAGGAVVGAIAGHNK